jgi:plasmid stabilization system protein ParE
MLSYRVIIMPRAGDDLEKIFDHIAKDSIDNAASMIRRILDAIELLRDIPHRTIVRGRRGKKRDQVRTVVVKPYVVYFRVVDEEQVVHIVHVRHGARRRPRRLD